MMILFLAALGQIALCVNAGLGPEWRSGEVSIVQVPAPTTNAPLHPEESGAFNAIYSGFHSAGSRG